MSKLAKFLSMAVVAGALVSGAAQAETVYLTTESRTYVSDWVIAQNNGCPPGTTLVKKEHLLRNDSYRCVAPRNAGVVFYKPGTIIPKTVTYTALPTEVVAKLPAPPTGQIYVSANNNVYLLDPESRTVVDGVAVVGVEE